jgi:hypothetical protein
LFYDNVTAVAIYAGHMFVPALDDLEIKSIFCLRNTKRIIRVKRLSDVATQWRTGKRTQKRPWTRPLDG